MMAKTIRHIGALLCVCALLALTMMGCGDENSKDKESEKSSKLDKQLAAVMEGGRDFEKLDLTEFVLPDSVTAVYEEGHGLGYVVELTVNGYGEGMVILCGVSADGVVTGAECLSSNEALGEEQEYGESFIGEDINGVASVDTIMGATLTTNGYKNAVKDALNAVLTLGGADVDVRTPEQILQDNLAAALPAGEGKFTKLFFTEKIEGVDAVYSAHNDAGYVAVIGEEFIGIEAGAPTAYPAIADAIKAMTESNPTAVDLTAYEGIDKNVQRVTKTASGNYIVEVNGLGFGYFGDETHYVTGQNIPIVIRVSLTPEGKIIDTLTVSHSESKGYGAVCGEESYYGQFDGKTIENYKDVDTIGGATITNNGYLKAIERCFEAVAILEGGAE